MLDQGSIRCIEELASVLRRGVGKGSENTAGDELRAVLAIRDVEAPDAAAQVGGVKTIGVPIAIGVERGDSGRYWIEHLTQHEMRDIRAWPPCVPVQLTGGGIQDVDAPRR